MPNICIKGSKLNCNDCKIQAETGHVISMWDITYITPTQHLSHVTSRVATRFKYENNIRSRPAINAEMFTMWNAFPPLDRVERSGCKYQSQISIKHTNYLHHMFDYQIFIAVYLEVFCENVLKYHKTKQHHSLHFKYYFLYRKVAIQHHQVFNTERYIRPIEACTPLKRN